MKSNAPIAQGRRPARGAKTTVEGHMKINALIAYLTCFTTGCAVLIIELVAFRMLAPYFGTSSYVTGIIINTVLLALAVGYYIGGYVADRHKSVRLPYILILAACVYLLVFYYLYPILLETVSRHNAIAGSFIAIFAMFFLPMIVLAFIPPYLIKMLTTLDSVGITAGRIYSLGTIGSIVGGMMTTFVLVPYLGSAKTYMTGIVLLLIISVVGLVRFHKASLLVLLLALLPFRVQTLAIDRAIHSEESQYNIIKVTREGGEYFMHLNNYFGFHSKSLDDRMLSDSPFDRFLITPLMVSGRDVMILGNGAGTIMTQFTHFFDLYVEGVEIDARLTRVGREWLKLIPDERNTKVVHNDARYHLNRTDRQYDIIIVDLYMGSPYIPFHCATVEFFRLVESRLRDDGVMAINFPPYAVGTELETYYLNTIRQAFPSLHYSRNLLLAFKADKDLADVRERIREHEENEPLYAILQDALDRMEELTVDEDSRLVFTDDHAPIENLIFKILKM